ncbi:MAG: glutathione S-transferase N-terminal domain-containing protein [Alphaproteobacteria bacterium]|nr:glutathione S-transferase N-terminal domain-containing protein [Alphaproteobacteria bacterium]
MIQLYFSPGACSFVPHALLEESGLVYEPIMVKLHKGEQNAEPFKALNPRGQVPVLVQDGVALNQIVALCLHIDALCPERGFLPRDPIARTQALSNLAWMNNTVHPTFTHVFMPQKFHDDTQVQGAIREFAVVQFGHYLDDLQQMVAHEQSRGQPWLSGDRWGPLDAYALTLTRWGSIAGHDPQQRPVLWTHVQQVAEQPGVARTIERERLNLNMYRGS